MTTLHITIDATIEVPDGRPLVDYVRAVGNYLVDALPVMEGDTKRTWSAGRDVTISTDVKFEDDEL